MGLRGTHNALPNDRGALSTAVSGAVVSAALLVVGAHRNLALAQVGLQTPVAVQNVGGRVGVITSCADSAAHLDVAVMRLAG